MQYNSTRNKLRIPEYGRNIQRMIEYAITVENRDERNFVAKSIIKIMGQLNPHLRDVADFNHKLWDHLFIISDFKLDVDSPYPKPEPETLMEKPKPMNYPENNLEYRHYGKIMKRMILKAAEWEEGPEKDALVDAIANHLKKCYLTWNRDSVADDVIFDHMKELSEGKLKFNPEDVKISDARDLNTGPHHRTSPTGKRRGKSSKGRGRRKR